VKREYAITSKEQSRRARTAYLLLYGIFILIPIVAGLDTFFDFITDWTKYISPAIPGVLQLGAGVFIRIAGIIEIITGIVVALRPHIGGWIFAAWLWAIIINLLILGTYYEISLIDFGLSIAALALAQIDSAFRKKIS